MRRLALGLVFAVLAVPATEATHLYIKGRAAEKAGRYDQAYVYYSEAAALEPNNLTYWQRSQAVRSRAALQAKPQPPRSGVVPDLTDDQAELPPANARDRANLRRAKSPDELQSDVGPREFDLQGDPRALFNALAKAFQFDCVFDPEYPQGRTLRFRVEAMGYKQALNVLQMVTGSIVRPLSSRRFLVAQDTPQKRAELEKFVSVAVELPDAVNPQELTEVSRAVQQALALERVSVDAANNLVILRGPVSKVGPAQMLFEDLLRHRSDVNVEVEFLELDRNDMLTYGVSLPTSFPIQNVQTVTGTLTTLAQLARGAAGGYGIAIGASALLAQLSQSNGRSLQRFQLRSVEGQPATLHVGDRYPVLTAAYIGGQSSTLTPGSAPGVTSGTGGTSGTPGSTPTPATFGDVQNPTSVVIGDFNQDGLPDLAATASGSNQAVVLLTNEDGTLQPAAAYATGSNPSAIVAADLNKDGVTDLVTADAGSNTVSVSRGNQDGTFQPAMAFAVGSSPAALEVSDFNGDGIPDLVVANSGSDNLSVLLGEGDGTFQPALTQAAGSSPRSLTESDFNGDGIADLAVANFSSNDVWVLLGNGDGTFRRDATYVTGNAPRAVLAARLTQNGQTDLVVANSASNSVSVFLGAGLGRFADGVQYPAGSGPVALASGDFNSDGIPDLITVNTADNTISLIPGLGDGAFQAAIAIPLGGKPVAVTEGDFNRDGRPDLVVANSGSNDFSILLGAGTGSFHDPGGTFFTSSGGQAYTPPPAFTYQDLGLSVKVTPHVNGTEAITLDLDTEVQLLTGRAVNGLPILSHRKFATQIRLQTGEWAILGGLLSDQEARSLAGISGLANLPGIGALLRQNTKTRDKAEVLILIKANLDSLPASALATHAIPIGTETRPVAP